MNPFFPSVLVPLYVRRWGESGYIRVLRNPEKEPCAQDPSPLDGVCGKSGACKCNQTVTYCGTCGILADSSYPTGAKLQSSADAAPAEFPPRDASTNYATGYVWSDSPAKAQAPVLSEAPNFAAALASTPSSIDVVSPVKDQGQCGACWAFSTAENVESAFALATNTPVQKLSVEQILVCCGDDISTCSGCMGGDPIVAYGYLQNRSAGLDSEAAYPYDPHTDPFDPPKCKADVSKPVAKVTGWSYAVPRCEGGECAEEWRTGGGAEEQLAAVVATQGPVSICIDAEKSLKNYKGGVLDPDDCSTAVKSLNHCVHLVGFDTSGDEPYWLVKNSWGEKFGEDGYFRLAYGKNACGITDEATVVHVAKP